jgi:hypothetical protein
MKLSIKKFDPANMKEHRIILLVGRRGMGKSVLMRDLMQQLAGRVDFGLAMTPTEDTAEMFREHMPESWIYNAFNTAKLETMLALQRDLCKSKKQRNLFVLMDDCMYDKKVLKSTAVRDLFMNGRHMHLTFMNAVQYIMDISPDLRTQVDYVFAFKENTISNKQRLWKYFFGIFDKYDDFVRVFDRCTANYGVLVLDNTCVSSDICDNCMWYRARSDVPPFRMGKPIFWRLSEGLMKSDEEVQRAAQGEAHWDATQRGSKRITFVEMQDASGHPVDDELTMLVN